MTGNVGKRAVCLTGWKARAHLKAPLRKEKGDRPPHPVAHVGKTAQAFERLTCSALLFGWRHQKVR